MPGHLVTIDVELLPHFEKYEAELKRMLSLTKAGPSAGPGSGTTTAAAKGDLQKFAGQGRAQIEMARRAGSISDPEAAKATKILNKAVSDRAAQLQISNPTEALITKSYEAALKQLAAATKTHAGHAADAATDAGRVAKAVKKTAAKAEAEAAKPAARATSKGVTSGGVTKSRVPGSLADLGGAHSPAMKAREAGKKATGKTIATHAIEVGGCGGPVHGRLTPGCPRCNELIAGAEVRQGRGQSKGWNKSGSMAPDWRDPGKALSAVGDDEARQRAARRVQEEQANKRSRNAIRANDDEALTAPPESRSGSDLMARLGPETNPLYMNPKQRRIWDMENAATLDLIERANPPGRHGGPPGAGPGGPPGRHGDPQQQLGKANNELLGETKEQVQVAGNTLKAMKENLSHIQRLAATANGVVPGGIQDSKNKAGSFDDLQHAENRKARRAAKGDFAQRVQQAVARREGKVDDPIESFASGRQLVKQKLLTTAAYGGSGAVLYGAMNLGGDILDEAGDLQQQLALVKDAFDATGDAAQSVTFDEYKEGLREISLASGVAVSEVANVTRQLAGAFSEGGKPDFEFAKAEADVAVRFAELTGLPQQEITDSLTAISLAFDRSFTEIADSTIYAAKSFGVLETNLVAFTGDVAPLAAELGFTAEQVIGLGAAMQKGSSKSGSMLAENLTRILPALQAKRADIIRLLAEGDQTAGSIPKLTKAFQTGEIDEVMGLLVEQYANMSDANKGVLISLAGGTREAAAFASILKNKEETLRGLGMDKGDGDGAFENKWKERTKTVQQQMKLLRTAVEDFGLALFDSGIGDALLQITQALAGIAKAGGSAFGWIGTLNSGLKGIPSKLGAIYLSMKAIKMLGGFTGGFGMNRLKARLGGRFGGAGMQIPGGYGSDIDNLYTGGPNRQQAPKGFMGRNFGGQSTMRSEFKPAGRLKTALGSPELAAAMVLGAVATVQKYNDDMDNEKKALRERIAQGVKEGVDIEVYKQQAADVEDSSWLGTKFANAFHMLTPTQQVQLTTAEEAEKVAQPGFTAGMEAITDSPTERKKLAKAWFESTEGNDWEKASKEERKSIEKAMKDRQEAYAKNPTDPTANSEFKGLMSVIAGTELNNDFWRAVGLKENEQETLDAEATKAAKAVEEKAAAALAVDEAMTRFDLGEINIEALTAAFQKEGAILLQILTNPNKDSAQFYEDLANFRANQKQQRETLAAAIATEHQSDLDVMSVQTGGGQSTPAREHLKFTQNFIDMTAPGSNFSLAQTRQAAKEMMESGYAANQAYVDKGPSATVKAQRYRQQKNPVSPEAALAYNRDQFTKGAGGAMAQALGTGLGLAGQGYGGGAPEGDPEAVAEGTAEAAKLIVALVTEGNVEVDKELLRIIDVQIAALEKKHEILFWLRDKAGMEQITTQLSGLYQLRDQLVAEGLAGVSLLDPKNTENDPEVQAGLYRAGDMERVSAKYALLKARERDPIGDQRYEISRLKETLRGVTPGDKEGRDEILAQIIEAENTLDDMLKEKAKKMRDLRWDILRALNYKNPLKIAQIDIEEADFATSTAVTDEEKAAAELMRIQARNSFADASDEITNAKFSYAATLAGDGSIGAAMVQYALADKAVTDAAEGSAAQWQALAERVNAGRALRESMMNLFASQKDLAAALFEASGEALAAARQQLDVANERYRRALAAGDTPEAELNALHAEAVRQQTAMTGAERSDRLGDLAYLFEFDKITVQGYIAKLQQELQAIPESNKEARREIERQIKSLRDAVGKDLSFNLPSNLKIPTLYEARRLGQSSPGGYQDNRTVTITLNANNAIDGSAAVQQIVDAINGPPRVGVSPRAY